MQIENIEYKFNIYGKSITFKGKHKCGDFFKYEYINNQIVILSVADGVGSRKCDWFASKTACESFIKNLRNTIKNEISESQLLEIVKNVDSEIKNTTNNCSGMLAVFSAVVWDIGMNYFYMVNVGDTRVYIKNKQELSQKSEDETKAVIMKDKAGKLLTSGGTAIIRTGITNALGTGQAEVNVEKNRFGPGESIIIATDGYYNCLPTFKNDLKSAINQFDLTNSLDKVSSYYKDYIKDDATIVVLRRNDYKDDLVKGLDLINDFDIINNNIPQHLIIGLLFKSLMENINYKNKKNCLDILNIIDAEKILFSKEQINEIISRMKETNFMDPQIFSIIVKQLKQVMRNI